MPPVSALCFNGWLMSSSHSAAPKPASDASAALRALPSVDELLGRPRIAALAQKSGLKLTTAAIRAVLAQARQQITSPVPNARAETDPGHDADLESRVVSEVESMLAPSLRRLINATGVVLHTNLGRAPLARQAVARIVATATQYNNLEYDLPHGQRGKRDVHTSGLLADLCGTESAIVVNNNAAAVFLVLHALAKGDEVIVSRGELIEIGDGFRIPDIMVESGAILREVGTTNRTSIPITRTRSPIALDYCCAFTPRISGSPDSRTAPLWKNWSLSGKNSVYQSTKIWGQVASRILRQPESQNLSSVPVGKPACRS